MIAQWVIAQDTKPSADSLSNSLGDKIIQMQIPLMVANIQLVGNKKTNDNIVLREIPFQKGTRIMEAELTAQLLLARQQLMNTALFVDVLVTVAARKGNLIDVQVELKERWYLFPLPYFKLVDRNFNQWWVEQKRNLSRVNYGIKFIQNNVSGRNDNLDIWLIAGYTQQLSLRYNLPFFDKKLKSGFNTGIIYATQKELNYATIDNKQLFYRQEEVVRKTLRLDFSYSYRPAVKHRHYFRVSYNQEEVSDTVVKINPQYFPDKNKEVKFLDFAYQYKYYNVDYIPYPTKGIMVEANLYKRSLEKLNNLWQISARSVFAVPINKTTFLHLEGMAMFKQGVNNYFFNQRMFGYGYFNLRGLEYNVIDGDFGGALKTTLHKKVLSFVLKNPIPSKTHDKIPFQIFLKAYGDLGYGYNNAAKTSNTLNNTLIKTWGLGIDIVSIYDFVFNIEYSFNQLGRDGIYLHTKNDF